MDKHYFLELLHRYLKDEATKEEHQFLLNYYNLFQSEPDVLALLSQEKKEELKSQMHTSIWQNISSAEQPDENVKPIKRWLVRMVAAAILLAICTIGVFFLRNESTKKQTVAAQVNQQKLNRLVRLPDGSTVIVSSGSKLNYPSSFDGLARREVYLEGQAFFDIKHNASKPFIVHTGQLETTVLGTAFNIKAFPGDIDITVTVTRGKVKVSDQNKTLGIILPRQQITCNKQKANSTLKTVDADTYLDWKAQDLLFDDVTVAEAAELLEERFNVNITFSDQLIKSNRFTTTFLKGESLEQVLKSICEFNDAVYQYDKEKATVIISNSKNK
ncbi:FecR family protein [Daejeonella sp.]|uniref:FecR family protein n=1 Tax=Daejeonella sp. TaxID=2805397 RepID=UPI00398343B5